MEIKLKVIIEGRKPNCYLCDIRGHLKMECPKYNLPHTKEVVAEQQNTVKDIEEVYIEPETRNQRK